MSRRSLERARERAPGALETAIAQGAHHLHVDWDFAATAERFNRILDLHPNHAEAIHELSRVRAFAGRWEEAERLSRRALALDPFHGKASEFL